MAVHNSRAVRLSCIDDRSLPAIQQRRVDDAMYLPKVFDPAAHGYRVRYAIANILRDRAPHEGAFTNCFEMEDREEVILDILRRGLKNRKLRAALQGSHLINLTEWLIRHPEYSEAYYTANERDLCMSQPSRSDSAL
jgi:hypothetical protein